MITTDKLKAFKEQLDLVKIELDELLRVRVKEKLFDSPADYNACLKSLNYCPEEFYKLRLFDSEIKLCYNNRLKSYYIYFDTQQFSIIRDYAFNEFLKEFKITISKVSDKQFNLNVKDLNKAVSVFEIFCIKILKLHNSEESLFFKYGL